MQGYSPPPSFGSSRQDFPVALGPVLELAL